MDHEAYAIIGKLIVDQGKYMRLLGQLKDGTLTLDRLVLTGDGFHVLPAPVETTQREEAKSNAI